MKGSEMARFQKTSLCVVVAGLCCVSLASPATSQVTEGKTAFDHLKSADQRKPGSLVGDGFSRAQSRVMLPFGGIDITATEAPQSRADALFSTFLDNIFTAIADGITNLFSNLISSLFAGNITFPAATTPNTTTGSGTATTPGTTAPGGTTTPGTSTPPGTSTTPNGSRDTTTGGGRGGRR